MACRRAQKTHPLPPTTVKLEDTTSVMDSPTNAKAYLQTTARPPVIRPYHSQHAGTTLVPSHQCSVSACLQLMPQGRAAAKPTMRHLHGRGVKQRAYCVPRLPRHRKMPPADSHAVFSPHSPIVGHIPDQTGTGKPHSYGTPTNKPCPCVGLAVGKGSSTQEVYLLGQSPQMPHCPAHGSPPFQVKKDKASGQKQRQYL